MKVIKAIKNYIHKLEHKLGWVNGRLETATNEKGEMIIYFQCEKCGKKSGYINVKDDWIDEQIIRVSEEISRRVN